MLIHKKTTIADIDKHIAKAIQKGSSLIDIVSHKSNLIHTIYHSNRLDLLAEIRHKYGKEVINSADFLGNNLLHLSAPIDSIITKTLIDLDINPCQANIYGLSPFQIMCSEYTGTELEYIISKAQPYSPLSYRYTDGSTALMCAVKAGNHSGVESILKYDNCNVEATNNNGDNALIIAVKKNDEKMVRLILKTIRKSSKKYYQNGNRISPYDIASITGSMSIMNLLEEHNFKPSIAEKDVKDADKCAICDQLMLDPVILKCPHKFCMGCFLLSNGNNQEEKLLCPYRCENPNLSRATVKIDHIRQQKITENYSKKLVQKRAKLNYLNKAYLVMSKLGTVAEDMSLRLYKGALEFYIKFNENRLRIDIKTGIWIPDIPTTQCNMLKLLLAINQPSSKIGIGSLYLGADNMVYCTIDLPLAYLNTDSLDKLLDGIVLPIQTLIASIGTFINVSVVNLNISILQNIESEFLRIPKLADVLFDLHNIDQDDLLTSASFLSRTNTIVDVSISTDNCFIELSRVVGRIETNHTPSYKYILSYWPVEFEKIHNPRISVSKITGIVTFHSIVIYALAPNDTLTEQYSLIEDMSYKIQQSIKVNCRQQ